MERPPKLNLPPIDIKLQHNGSQTTIYDPLRGKYVVLTPEEWVRQHFTSWLINHRGYPSSYVVNEQGLLVNGHPRRADTVIYDRSLQPLAVVEYKNASIAITQRVFDQIVRYNMVFRAPFIMVSNGLNHYCCAIDFTAKCYRFLRDIPDYPTLLEGITSVDHS